MSTLAVKGNLADENDNPDITDILVQQQKHYPNSARSVLPKWKHKRENRQKEKFGTMTHYPAERNPESDSDSFLI